MTSQDVFQMNNPVEQLQKAKDLLLDEIALNSLLPEKACIYFASLLRDKKIWGDFL